VFFYAYTLRNFDVVQFINPFIFYNLPFPRLIVKTIIRNNNKSFFLGAGDDAYLWRYARKHLKYSFLEDFLKYDLKQETFYMESNKSFSFNNFVLEQTRGVIPIMFEYEVCYKDNSKRLPTIPIAININKIEYQDNRVANNKLVIFHGLNKYGFKGTRHVEEAFKYLSEKYPNDLELVIDGKLPLKEYLELMKRMNVVIDQTSSHSCGMNALLALAMGKVVLGGAEPEGLEALNIKYSPVINIKPSAQSIIDAIEKLLSQKDQILEMGKQSRAFIKEHHDYQKIAQRYIEVWNAH
jgi:glycosyltransferase involved in cell wall biosynthesis